MSRIKRYLASFIALLGHDLPFFGMCSRFEPHHYTTLHLFGKEIHACSRCLGMYLTGIPAFIIAGLLYLYNFTFSFWLIFGLSWFLASLCIIDWSSAKLGLRKGNNKARIITGASLGIALSMYFWLLPIPWIPRLFSLGLYNIIFGAIILINYCKEYNISLSEQISRLFNPFEHKQFSCCCESCLCGCCCSEWWCWLLLGCCCICPLIACLCGMGIGGCACPIKK